MILEKKKIDWWERIKRSLSGRGNCQAGKNLQDGNGVIIKKNNKSGKPGERMR